MAESEAQLLALANEKIRLLAVKSMRPGSVKFSPALVVTAAAGAPEAPADAPPPIRSSLKRCVCRRRGCVGANARPRCSTSSRGSGTGGVVGIDVVSEIASFRDSSLRTGCFVCGLLDAIRPGSVNWKWVTPAASIDVNAAAGVEACEANAKYALSLAMKLGCSVFITWKDVVDVNSKAVVLLVAQLVKMDLPEA